MGSAYQDLRGSEEEYCLRLKEFLAAIACSIDLADAQHEVQQHFSVVLDSRFLPAFLTLTSGAQAASTGYLTFGLAQMAITEVLAALSPEHLGMAGLLDLLVLGEDGISVFDSRYGSSLDGAFFAGLDDLVEALKQSPELQTDLASAEAARLRRAGEALFVSRALRAIEPLLAHFPVEEPQTFMELVTRQAQRCSSWLLPGLDRAAADFLEREGAGNCGVVLCTWTLRKAIEILPDLSGTEVDAIADILRAQAMAQVGTWLEQAVSVGRMKAAEAWTPLAVWLAWGNHPPKPHQTLRSLGRVLPNVRRLVKTERWLISKPLRSRCEDDLRRLVEEEPWLLSEPLINNIGHGGMFALIPELLGYGEELQHIAGWLRDWQSEQLRPEQNPIMHLAGQVRSGTLTQDEALAQIRHQRKLKVLQLTAVDESIQDIRHRDPGYAALLAELNYEAACVLQHPLMQGYAALTMGFVRLERHPLPEIQRYLEEAVGLARRLDHPVLLAHALDALGQAYTAMGQTDAAVRYFHEAQTACHRLPPGYGRAETLLNLAQLYLENENLVEAERYLKQAFFFIAPQEISINAGRYYFLRGGLAWCHDDGTGTDESWKRSDAIARQLGHLSLQSDVIRHLARRAMQKGDLQTAQRFLQEVKGLAPRGEEVGLLEDLATLATQEGHYQDALDILRQALSKVQRLQNPTRECAIRLRRVWLYQTLDWNEESQQEQAQLERLAYELDDEELEVHLLQNRGRDLSDRGKYPEALISYRAALSRARRRGQARLVPSLLQDIAATYLNLRRPERALWILQIARAYLGSNLTPLTEIGIQMNEAGAWAQQGRELAEQGKTDAARTLCHRAEQVWQRMAEQTAVPLTIRLQALSYLGNLHAETGDQQQQARAYRHAVELMDQERLELSSEVIQRRFLRDRTAWYEAAVLTSVAAGEVADAVEIAERMRARLLGGRLLHLQSVPPEYRQHYQEALSKLQQAQGRWFGMEVVQGDWVSQQWAIRQTEWEREPINPEQAHAALEQAQRTFDSFVSEIQRRYPDFAPLWLATPPTLTGIQAMMADQPQTALVYLQTNPVSTVALIVTAGKVEALTIPLTREQVINMLMIFRLGAPRSAGFLRNAKGVERLFRSVSFADTIELLSKELGRLVWADLHPRLQMLGVQQLVLLPDSFLALLPLHAAALMSSNEPAQNSQATRWVLDHYSVAYAPSAQVLGLCRQRATERGGRAWGALVEGSLDRERPLLYSAAVATALTDALGPGTALWSEEADLEKLKTLSAGAPILHFHVHGRFDADLPEKAALHLAWEKEAGVWRLREMTLSKVLQTLSLEHNRLVVLSACESGEVAMERLPEFVGLPGAFLVAGAPTVIAAPWRVDELATTLLFSKFYHNLASGSSIVASLQQAQTWLRDLSRKNMIFEMEQLRAAMTGLLKKLPYQELAKSRTVTGGAIRQFGAENAMLVRLMEDISRVDREAASEILLREMHSHPPEADPLEAHLHRVVENLWMNMTAREWTVSRLQQHLERLRDYPFASPYYWGGFQVVGAS